jgi:hypothetical protein
MCVQVTLDPTHNTAHAQIAVVQHQANREALCDLVLLVICGIHVICMLSIVNETDRFVSAPFERIGVIVHNKLFLNKTVQFIFN